MNNPILPSLPEMGKIWQETLNWQPKVQHLIQFQKFYELIVEGNCQQNLTRITEPLEFWEKHLWDSLRGVTPLLLTEKDREDFCSAPKTQKHKDTEILYRAFHNAKVSPVSPRLDVKASSSNPLSIIDIGTGAGIPGIPVGITVSNCTVTLLDSTKKKITFLDKTLTALNLKNIKTLTSRSEEIGRQPQYRNTYDVALIRAVGTASICAEYALPLLKQGGLAIVYRGNWTEDEAKALEKSVAQLGGVIELVEKFTTPLSHSIRHCLYLRKVA